MSEGLVTEAPLGRGELTRTWLPFIVIVLIWGSTWLVIVGQLGVVPPSWSVTYRFLLAAATMFAAALVSGAPLRLHGRDWLIAGALGLCQFVLNFNLVYRAEQYVTSGLVAVVFALLIVPNAVLGRIFLGHGVSKPFFAGSAMALVGIGLLFAHELASDRSGTGNTALGIGITLIAVFAASIGNVLQGTERAKAMPMTTMLAWSMLIGALGDGAFAWATVGPPVIERTWPYLLGVLYLGVFASALAFTLYFQLIRRIGPARAGYSSAIVPVQAMALSTIFEGYRWGWEAVLGGLLVLAGLVVALRARNPVR